MLSAVSDASRTAKGRNRDMGQAAFAVHQAAPQTPLYQSTDKLQTHRIPRRHRRSGRGNVLSVGKTTRRKRRRNRTAKSRQSNAVGRGSPVETSAAGRSADRADRRDSE